jgi:adenosylcobinamide-phosphate synthase
MLVSRDTAAMDGPQLRRALAETLAENFNDAFVAPLFWLMLGGPVALWLYKTVSTFDSMWGYRTEQWEKLGKAGALCDDALAWIPARLSAVLLYATAQGQYSKEQWPGWAVVRQQAHLMASPNAGWPMVAAAWLHNAGMGGPTPYFGKVVNKPQLGPQNMPQWDDERLQQLINHLRRAGLWGIGAACGGALFVS